MFKSSEARLDNVYFIFADNVYIKYITYERFKALINFYLLIYNTIVIPDTFFLNNKYLIKFLQSEDGMNYINEGIIKVSLREEVDGLKELHRKFKEDGTLLADVESNYDIIEYLDKIESSKCIKWKEEQIAANFKNNLFNNIKSIDMNELDKKSWIRKLYSISTDKTLKRKDVRLATRKMFFRDQNSLEYLNSYIDISYNFNIPNYFKMSAAYPDEINRISRKLSPEKVFLNDAVSCKCIQEIAKEDYSKQKSPPLRYILFLSAPLGCNFYQ